MYTQMYTAIGSLGFLSKHIFLANCKEAIAVSWSRQAHHY